jgi:hypothetical protein
MELGAWCLEFFPMGPVTNLLRLSPHGLGKWRKYAEGYETEKEQHDENQDFVATF